MATQRICSVEGCGKAASRPQSYCEGHYWRWKKYGDSFDRGPVRKRAKHGEIPELLNALIKSDSNECILWPHTKTKGGYGECYVDGHHWLVHRYICVARHGAPPSASHEAAHSCHQPSCANPNHLRWATPKQNQADRALNGTLGRGEAHVGAKLTRSDVINIRRLVSQADRSPKDIGVQFGVSPTLVRRIRDRKAWAWLPD